MKRLLFMVGLLLAFSTSILAEVKTDTICFVSRSGSNVYEFSNKVRSGIELEVDGRKIKPDSGVNRLSGRDVYIYYTYEYPTEYTSCFSDYPETKSDIRWSGDIDSLDVSRCTSLIELNCSKTGDYIVELGYYLLRIDPSLRSLNVRGCTALRFLNCSYSNLINLDVSDCVSLERLDCSFSGSYNRNSYNATDDIYRRPTLENLNVRGCTALRVLDCRHSRLTSLDMSNCTSLIDLDCSESGEYSEHIKYKYDPSTTINRTPTLESLDVSGCTSLTRLNCSYNQLTTLDVSGCTSLTRLNCSYNQLTTLDVSGFTSLTILSCYSNQLTTLDVSGFTSLTGLSCDSNRIPLSTLYNAYAQNNTWSTFSARNQSDSIMLLINAPWDLSTERIIGQITTDFELTDALGREVSSNFWTENRFVFQFHEPLRYTLKLNNPNVNSTFTWHISVVEEMPVNYFTVKVASNNVSWGTATISGNGTYEECKTVTITAMPQEGYRFVNWTKKDGAEFSTEAVHAFTVTENLELTANFEKRPDDVETFTVSLLANNPEWGRVSQTGDGIYEEDQTVTITATPQNGYRFVNWTKKDGGVFSTEAMYSFTVTENLELTANFEKRPDDAETFTISLSVNNPEWGIVSQIGYGVYDRDESATIIATPKTGYRFMNWTKKDDMEFSTEAVHTFTVTENLELTANFEKIPDDVANEYQGTDNLYIYAKDRTIYLSENVGAVQVYNVTGQCVYSGASTAIPVRQSGVHIIRIGMRNYKVVVK